VNYFVQGIQVDKKNWINTDLMYTPTKHGGLGMVRLSHFTEAIRVSWIRRYAIECTDDHWADIIDHKLNLNINTRNEILNVSTQSSKQKSPSSATCSKATQYSKHTSPT
jgi:hypothetical protein